MTPLRQNRETIRSIQALRALAVTTVVLQHYFPRAVPGGFIGVDVFFVISGFLMTDHITRRIGDGSFSLRGFFLRRFRRLLPAAILVLGVTLPANCLLLPFATLIDGLRGGAAATLYVSNWFFAVANGDYFSGAATRSPFLHYWSLSVEEQFYAFWPFFLLLATSLASRTGAKGNSRIPLALLALAGVLSFGWSVHSGGIDPGFNYFDTFARIWEFAVGGAVALLARRIAPPARLGAPAVLVLWIVLVASAFALNSGSSVPGPDALIPIFATAGILLFKDAFLRLPPFRWIAARPVQGLGAISYSLYLWHWPLLVLAPYALGQEAIGTAGRIGLVAVCLGLSYVTARHVEERFRWPPADGSSRPTVPLLRYAAVGVAAFLVFILSEQYVYRHSVAVAGRLHALSLADDACFGARARQNPESCPQSNVLSSSDFAGINRETQQEFAPFCQQTHGDPDLKPCAFGAAAAQAAATIAVLGDSHAAMWLSLMGLLAQDHGWRVKGFAASSCTATLDRSVYASYLLRRDRRGCRAWREKAIDAIAADPDIDVVVVSGLVSRQKRLTRKGRWVTDKGGGYVKAWSRVLAAGKKVLVINDVPTLPLSLPDCLASSRTTAERCTYRPNRGFTKTRFTRAAAAINDKNLLLVDLRDVFCDGDTCHSIIGGIPAFLDRSHITAPFSHTLRWKIEPALASLLGQ